jgi:hypothetical protein
MQCPAGVLSTCNAAAMGVDNFVDNGQSQPGSVALGGEIGIEYLADYGRPRCPVRYR